MNFESPNILVLGAGGIIGEAWLVGMLAGLRDASGFDARECDCFIGTSAGSIVAAGLAAGVDPRTRLNRLPEQPPAPPPGDDADSLLGTALRLGRGAGAAAAAPFAALALRTTEFGGAAVRRTALGRVPAGTRSLAQLGAAIEDLHVGWDGRLLIATVELESGRRVVFGEPGEQRLSVANAVQASCAIPGVFRPIPAGGSTYVDGGAWSLTNMDVAPVRRGSRVLCLNPTGALAATATLRGAVGPLSRSVAAVEALTLQRRGAQVTTLAPDTDATHAMGSNFMDPQGRERAQAAGFAQGRRAVARLAA
jgi:NTE family protein